MTEEFNELVKEAKELHSYFLTTWWRLSHRCSLIYPRWKQKVFKYVRYSLGEKSRFYTDLAEAEKEYSDSMPVEVFLRFQNTLKEIQYLSEASLLVPPSAPTEPVAPLPAPQLPSEQLVAVPPVTVTPVAPDVATPPPPMLKAPLIEIKVNPKKPYMQLDLEARDIYGGLLAAARGYISCPDRPPAGAYGGITTLCDSSLEALKANPVLLNYMAFSSEENYLYAHSANVTILSQAIALDLNLPQEEIRLLSFCAMVHDQGMTQFQELSSKKEYITDAEYSQVALHVEAGASWLDSLADIDSRLKERIKTIISQVHERVNSTGYPSGLSGKEIDLLAQIIGAADVYEAMTHPRSWREALPPPAVIKEFIERKSGPEFSPKILKALLHVLSMYPPSSLVSLSDGEIARVIKLRKGSLTRPLVEILLDADFVPVHTTFLDLYEAPFCAIVRPVSLAELKKIHPVFAAALQAEQWWVENKKAEPQNSPAYARQVDS